MLRTIAPAVVLCVAMSGVLCAQAAAALPPPDSPQARQEAQHLDQLPPVAPHAKAPIDHSGRKQKGHASYYAGKFAHRKMADGKHLNPQDNVAASKTLPLGTTAKVTNLENGRSATVKVEDRGPYVKGRVVDVTPKVAQELDMKKHGVVPVEVKPIAVPQPNGEIKLGAGAAELPPRTVEQATKTTEALAGTKGTQTAEK
jgi:rare lipoprotein A